jgi:hypothetical protein
MGMRMGVKWGGSSKEEWGTAQFNNHIGIIISSLFFYSYLILFFNEKRTVGAQRCENVLQCSFVCFVREGNIAHACRPCQYLDYLQAKYNLI